MMSGGVMGKPHSLIAMFLDVGLMLRCLHVFFVHGAGLHVLCCQLQPTQQRQSDCDLHVFALRNFGDLRSELLGSPVSECSRCDFCPGPACRIRSSQSPSTCLRYRSVRFSAAMSAVIPLSLSFAS